MIYAESETLELKRELTDDSIKTIVAFANTKGGTIIYGINDDSSSNGIPSIDLVLSRLTNMIRDSIVPDVTHFVSYKQKMINLNAILEVTVMRGTQRPYALKHKGLTPHGVFVRQGSSTVKASMDTIRMMITESDHRRYELEISANQALTFKQATRFFAERLIPFEKIHQKTLHLRDEEDRFTNLGMLLSDQCEHTTKVAIFQGTDFSIFRDRREFSGSLLTQLQEVGDYIQQYNRIRSEFPGLLRVDSFDYPPLALREALLNCYVHREYASSAATLMHVFDDRLECITFGGLVSGVSMEDLKLGISLSRNEYLARVLHLLGIIEAYGTGFPRIFEQYARTACKPVIETSTNAFKLTLPNRNYLVEHVGESDGVYEAYQYIKSKGSIQRKDLQAFLGISQTQAGLLLKRLSDKNLVSVLGRGKLTKYSAR